MFYEQIFLRRGIICLILYSGFEQAKLNQGKKTKLHIIVIIIITIEFILAGCWHIDL